MPYNFGPASEQERIVFGSARPPRYGELQHWLAFMKQNGIRRVCCLIDDASELLDAYAQAFGAARVLHAPIEDFSYATRERLTEDILPFLFEADAAGEPVVVHCWAGSGRTGHVLAAWLVAGRGVAPAQAPELVVNIAEVMRNPYEAEHEHSRLATVLQWAAQHRR
jgi:protein-tyrosine phosphatase